MRSRLGVLVLVTALALLCAAAPAHAARQLQKRQAAAPSAPPALASQGSTAIPFPFGVLDVALLSLAGAPVIFLAARRRQRAPQPVAPLARRRSE